MPVYRIGAFNVLFIHIPKTAGMAIDAHLADHGKVAFDTRIKVRAGEFGPRHQPASVLKTIFLDEMIDYAFMVVRHPVARLVSEYRYQHRHNALQRFRLGLMGFDLWLKYSMMRSSNTPGYRSSHFRKQVDYECFGCEVFRYEDGLDRIMLAVSRVTGVSIPLETRAKNMSAVQPVSISQNSLGIIARRYAEDFDRYNYSIEVPVIAGVAGPANYAKTP